MKRTINWRHIRRARIAANVSQILLAKAVGRSQRWISGVERGQVQITPAFAEKIVEHICILAGQRWQEVLRAISI